MNIKKIYSAAALLLLLVISVSAALSSCSGEFVEHIFRKPEILTDDPSVDGCKLIDTTPSDPDAPYSYTPFTPSERVVAFTFDDGPSANTAKILDKIEPDGSKVTFFTVGNNLKEAYIPSVKRASDMGCIVGVHALTHKYYAELIDQPKDVIYAETHGVADSIEKITGKRPCVMRPVGGNFSKTFDYGFALILWDVDSRDWDYYGQFIKGTISREECVNSVYNEVINDILAPDASGEATKYKTGKIILMHDIYPTTVDAFIKIYDRLSDEGYTFVTVEELLGPLDRAQNYYFYNTKSAGYNGKSL